MAAALEDRIQDRPLLLIAPSEQAQPINRRSWREDFAETEPTNESVRHMVRHLRTLSLSAIYT